MAGDIHLEVLLGSPHASSHNPANPVSEVYNGSFIILDI